MAKTHNNERKNDDLLWSLYSVTTRHATTSERSRIYEFPIKFRIMLKMVEPGEWSKTYPVKHDNEWQIEMVCHRNKLSFGEFETKLVIPLEPKPN